jgi:Sigma-70 region 2
MTQAMLPEFGANESGTVPQVDDKTLALEARRGAQSAFEELYRRHRRRMFRLAYRVTRSREDAEDAVQESFLNAYLHLKRLRGARKRGPGEPPRACSSPVFFASPRR